MNTAMPLPRTAYHALAPDLPICRLLNGMWQVSGAHGAINPDRAVAAMLAYHDAGLTTWDLADHYGPAEEFIGAFRRRLVAERGDTALASMEALTKWVPRPGPMTRTVVERAIDVSRRRMGVAALDLLQFHWWDYRDQRYIEALDHVADLQAAGAIRHLGLTNFDTQRLAEILDHGIPIVSNQVQYSLIDRRPQVAMAALCQERGVGLLAYGALCGGLLSDRYLDQPEPRSSDLVTASLRKYKQMIDAWGGWSLFQELLRTLRQIADRHQTTIATVAVRWMLDQPTVAGVIIGARLGVAEHIAANAHVFAVQLDATDHARLDEIHARAHDLFRLIGDCGDEYRR